MLGPLRGSSTRNFEYRLKLVLKINNQILKLSLEKKLSMLIRLCYRDFTLNYCVNARLVALVYLLRFFKHKVTTC